MKSSKTDKAEGHLHEVKGTIKEVIGNAVGNPDLEAEGKSEKRAGQVQKKIGEIKKIVGK